MTTIPNDSKYRQAYNAGRPIVPDDVYDDMFGTNETDLDDNNGTGQLVDHLHPMLSLPTFFENIDELTIQRLHELGFTGNKFGGDSYGTVSYKLDGVSVSAIYDSKQHKLLRLVSRGKRVAGFVLDKSWNVVFNVIKPKVALPDNIYDFRGELVISNDDFERINNTLPDNAKYANARNMIAANVNSLTPNIDVINSARLLMHGIWIDDKASLHFKQLSAIFDANAIAPFAVLNAKPEQQLATIKQMYKNAMQSNIPCDGIVIQTNMTSANLNGRVNLDRIAIKQMDEAKYSANTKVVDITWRLANDGHYFPHLTFEPVIINGSEVTHAAGYCWDYLVRQNISIGSEVQVTMRGGVIPKITAVHTAGTGNRNLPADVDEILPGDVHIWSVNSAENIQRLRFIRGMGMLDLENCGEALFSDMYYFGNFKSLNDVATAIRDNSFIDRCISTNVLPNTEASYAKLNTIINRFKTFNYVWYTMALRLDLIGFKAANAIGQYLTGYALNEEGRKILSYKAVQAVLNNAELLTEIKTNSNPVAEEHADLSTARQIAKSTKPKAILSKKPENGMTKAQFIEAYLQDYDITENIREANLLICPAGETSNKINYAKQHDIAIRYYSDFIK